MIRTVITLFSFLLTASMIGGCRPGSASDGNNQQIDSISSPVSLPDFSSLDNWTAGTEIDSTLLSAYGIEKCFVAESISDNIFAIMMGKTFHADTPIPRSDLRYLKVLHRDADGRIFLGELVCNRRISDDLLQIFKAFFSAGYPIEHMILPCRYDGDDESSMAANNTSCFNSRNMVGSRKPSNHAFGMAVDINPLYNPYVKKKNGKVVRILPQSAQYPSPHSPYHIERGDLCHKLFTAHGFSWGGAWKSVKDYQHFEKNP